MTAEATQTTEVALAWHDGMRFVGVQPPLSEEEIAGMVAEGLFRTTQVENITLEPACTLIRYGVTGLPAVATQKLEIVGRKIADFLEPTRDSVTLQTDIVALMGKQSSPFNPYTD